MANKMISEKDLRDDMLTRMIRSDEPMAAPSGFADDIMSRIGMTSPAKSIKAYKPPIWLKWGIPGFVLTCLLVLLIWEPAKTKTELNWINFFEKMSQEINSWVSGFNPELKMPDLSLSPTISWILAGGIVLTWGFILLSRFLEKKYRHHQ